MRKEEWTEKDKERYGKLIRIDGTEVEVPEGWEVVCTSEFMAGNDNLLFDPVGGVCVTAEYGDELLTSQWQAGYRYLRRIAVAETEGGEG